MSDKTSAYKIAQDMERNLLCSLILSPEQYYIIGEMVSKDSFYPTKHQQIYEAITSLIDDDEPVDLVSISAKLVKHGHDPMRSLLIEIAQAIPSGERAEYYAEQVQAAANRRGLDIILKKGIASVEDPTIDTVEILGDVQNGIDNVLNTRNSESASVYPEILNVWEEYLDLNDGGTPNWITTGFHDLDRYVCLAEGTHTVVGASPSEGKTSLGINILRNVSASGKRVLFFTLEQTRKRMLQKIISQEAMVPHTKLITGRLSEEEKKKVSDRAHRWSNPNMCIIDGRWSVPQIRLKSIQEKAEKGLDLIIVDLLGLLKRPDNLPKDAKEHHVYNENARQLQELGVELKVPVITMAHLNRAKYARPGGRPILSDLREAGEQFADNVIFIHREYIRTKDPAVENLVELLIAKNRDGNVGLVELGWHGKSTTFYNLDKHHEETAKLPEPEENDKDEQIVLGGGIQ